MRERIAPLSLLVLGVVPFGCNRSEPDRTPATTAVESDPPREPATTTTRATTHSPLEASAPATPSCIVPLSKDPAPSAAPAASCPPDPRGPLALRRGFVTFSEAPGTPRVEVEIADASASRERGLMYRTSMPEDQGMIFSWSSEAPRSFWMRDTCLPLDMLFITKDGTIAGVVEQVPVLNDTPRGVACPVAHVLELNAGWVRAHGVLPGQRVRIEG